MSQHINELEQMIKTLNYDEVEKINKHLLDFHDKELVFSRSAEEIDDIKLSVEDMIERIISNNKINGINVLAPDAHFDNTCLFSDARGQNI